MFSRCDVRAHIFIFLLNVCLFTVTGIVLHKSNTPMVVRACPSLWETMVLILVMKCLRVTLCAIVFRIMRGDREDGGGGRQSVRANPIDVLLFFCFFVSECVTTSRSLNAEECVAAVSGAFEGHPLLSYVNGIAAVWDGCYILSHALHILIKR